LAKKNHIIYSLPIVVACLIISCGKNSTRQAALEKRGQDPLVNMLMELPKINSATPLDYFRGSNVSGLYHVHATGNSEAETSILETRFVSDESQIDICRFYYEYFLSKKKVWNIGSATSCGDRKDGQGQPIYVVSVANVTIRGPSNKSISISLTSGPFKKIENRNSEIKWKSEVEILTRYRASESAARYCYGSNGELDRCNTANWSYTFSIDSAGSIQP
jgi:hypothetical protein